MPLASQSSYMRSEHSAFPQHDRPCGLLRSRNFVHRVLVGDAAQQRLMRHWGQSRFAKSLGSLAVADDGLRREDRARYRESLHARGDVDRLPEIVEAIVQHYG